jgi:regulator of protease activity HflC (stomatin/prohibitin superfamily)
MVDYTGAIVTGVLLFLVLWILLWRSVHTIYPLQMGVVTLFGAYKGVIRPGFNLVSPAARVVTVDLRTQHAKLPAIVFNLLSGTAEITIEVTYNVTDSAKFVFQVADVKATLLETAKSAFINVAGGLISGGRELTDFQLSRAVTDALNAESERWGVKIQNVVVQGLG